MFGKLLSAFRKPKVEANSGGTYPNNPRLIQAGWYGVRPFWQQHNQRIDVEVTPSEWRNIVSSSNRLYWNYGPIHGATEEFSTFVGGPWKARFCGIDRSWGALAEEWINETWMPIAYVSGGSFSEGIELDCTQLTRDGDATTLYTEAKSGFPQLQQIAWHQLGLRNDDTKVETGPFKGRRCYNGIILNDQNRAIGYAVRGITAADDRIYPANSVDFLRVTKVADQVRGFPSWTAALLDLRDLSQVQGYIKTAGAIAASIGLMEYNDTGFQNPMDPASALGLPGVGGADDLSGTGVVERAKLQYEEMVGGMIRYFKADSGQKLEQLTPTTPSQAQERLVEWLIRNALLSAQMPPEFFYRFDASGANVRVVIDKVNRAIERRQRLLTTVARRRVGYAISKAIKLGILPPYSGEIGGFLKWRFTHAAKLTADDGWSAQNAREAYKMGSANMADIQDWRGKTIEEHYRDRAYEAQLKRQIATEYGIPIADFGIITPNGNPPDQGDPNQNADGSEMEQTGNYATPTID